MMAVVESGSLWGVAAHAVRVEASPIRGLPGVEIVGMPEAGIRESRVRVLAALRNSGFELPEQRFVVNLAPADLRKTGSSFDLAIAIALLAQCGLCAPNLLPDTLIIGELSLDGQVRPVRGLLAHLLSARRRGLPSALIPALGSGAARLCEGLEIRCAEHLRDAVAFLGSEVHLPGPGARKDEAAPGTERVDLRDVRGQQVAKRALEVAAAGNHALLMIGPPGAGKSMLARRLSGILPPPTSDEALEIATISGAAGLREGVRTSSERPFRAPHHSCSDVALIGGGDPIRPGEVTLAHGGVLFLDELPEFRRAALEALRPTMESGVAAIVRARDRVFMPASPLIVAAMNPCPCGYQGQKKRLCRCSEEQVRRYRARVSGPLMDRFDLHVALPPLSVEEIEQGEQGEDSAGVQARVVVARERRSERERERGRALQKKRDARSMLVRLAAELEPGALRFLHRSMQQLALSLRAYVKVLHVSRTIADLDGSALVQLPQVAEAVQYRLFDRAASEARLDAPPQWPRAAATPRG